ncbi:glycosyltransferase family 2 protein [Algoriphagus aestuarii]|nr:glycosyltransferase family 2 protein [Algoriphagus aestuarii]
MKLGAIVILNYNGEGMLKKFLPSVLAYSQSDIWVIDNASTDGSLSLLEEDFPSVQTILLKENFGYAGGYNWGLSQLEGNYQYYILLNSDVEVTLGWDRTLLNTASENPDFAALQPKILSYQNPDQFDYAGAGGGFLDSLGYPYCRGRIWDNVEKDSGQYNDSIEVDWASGACMLVKADLFHQLSGFDGYFFAHMEEIDLCWRMRNIGWKIGYCGEVSIFHVGGATLERSSPRKLFLNIRNSLSMIYKNEGRFLFMWIFVTKFCLEFMAAISFYLKGQRENALAIRKGYYEFLFKRSFAEDQVIKGKLKSYRKRNGPVNFLIFHTGILRKKTFQSL